DNDGNEDARRASEASRDAEPRREGEAGREAQKKRAKKPKDPAKPTRAKANRPDFAPTSPELEKLLNPGIAGGTAGPGPSTGIRPLAPDFITGASATVRALERLLREGRPEFAGKPWMPHRPERPEKSEGGRRLIIKSEFEPEGDQPQAIAELVEGVRQHERTQVLLGVTGSGKTFTMAKVIEATQRPALILAPNKTLAAQLYGEFKSFFPDNAVEYFVSYYDYYQPEAYVPRTDTY